ncbi:MAG TPA: DUF6062 family protein [Aggregatilineales bacterium]|nr:hypothetical protein [Chloroflexota bacterium]HOA24315.1 DUF6062 family protein [Aggregatilineales bacterium]HPV06787.1 DUF6062 family protein [Aggregatilineales bacterium]HQA67392.1 DUF6062 family protein [Aggregatilineales bacterium]
MPPVPEAPMKRRSAPSQRYFDLVEALAGPGCPMCAILLQQADKLLQSILYERWKDQPTHDAIRARQGLCSGHAYQLTQYRGNVQTVAIFYRSAVDEVVRILDEMERSVPIGTGRRRRREARSEGAVLAARLAPRGPCIVCAALDETESRLVETMVEYFDDARLRESYEASDGLCLPHMQAVLAACDDRTMLRDLVAIQKRIWAQLRADVEAFIAKTREHSGDAIEPREASSPSRAIRLMPGEHDLFGVDPRSAWRWLDGDD